MTGLLPPHAIRTSQVVTERKRTGSSSTVVAETLKQRAAAAGMSLSAYAARELANIASRPTNAEIVKRLRTRGRSAGPSTAEIVEAVRDSRR